MWYSYKLELFYFKGCKNLRKVTLGEGITEVTSNYFNKATLEEITLPSTLETIGADTFANCKKLENVELNDGIKTIGDGAFEDSLIESITIPGTVRSMGYLVFNNKVLANITI